MSEKREHSQSALLLAHKSSTKSGATFKLHAPYKPTGDQPQAIVELVKGLRKATNSRLY